MTTPLVVSGSAAKYLPLDVDGTGTAELAPVIQAGASDHLGAGFARFDASSFVWRLDTDECFLVLEGAVRIQVGPERLDASQGDVVLLPGGTEVTYDFPASCLLFYVTYPVELAPTGGAT